MKKFVLSCALTLVAGGLSACNSRSVPSVNGTNGFASPQQNLQAPSMSQSTSSIGTFSNKVLDAVAVRARFIMFQNSDGNRDGFLTPGELMYGMDYNGIFAKIDTNKDGRISLTEFQKYKPASTSESYFPTRELLRQQATAMWGMMNKDGNSYLIQDEVEAFFSGNNTSPVPVPPPTSPGTPSGDGYGNGDYGNSGGYGAPYDNRQALQQAIQFFVQSDVNLDQKLTFSEYEDGYARSLLAFASKPSQPVYSPPSSYPSSSPGAYPGY